VTIIVKIVAKNSQSVTLAAHFMRPNVRRQNGRRVTEATRPPNNRNDIYNFGIFFGNLEKDFQNCLFEKKNLVTIIVKIVARNSQSVTLAAHFMRPNVRRQNGRRVTEATRPPNNRNNIYIILEKKIRKNVQNCLFEKKKYFKKKLIFFK
jgi:CRISPR/Cas system CSM-associated protein Csm2 small subunit